MFFDRRWIVVVPSASTPAFFWKLRAPLGAFMAVLCAVEVGLMLRAGNWGPAVHGGIFLAIGLALVVTGIRAWRRPPGFVALSQEGLIVFRGGEAHEMYPWPRIQDIQIDSPGYAVILSLPDRRDRLPGRTFLHGSGAELMDCVGRIRMYQLQRLQPPARQ